MHSSRLSSFVIDCRTDDVDAAADFWAQALGRRVLPADPAYERYRAVETAPSEPLLLVQRVEHDSRIHLDVESDDIPAEVARLEALGARRVEAIRTWVVMEAPTGQRFCVVRPQRGPMVLSAQRWPGDAGLPPPTLAPEHERMAALVGRYHGTTRTWFEPGAAPEEEMGELRIEPLLGGRYLRVEERGVAMGKPRAGELTLGFQREPAEFQASWVDTFHTAGMILVSTGTPRPDGMIAVTGSYPVGPTERWRWRTEIDPPAEDKSFVMRAYNITSDGEEMLAMETRWTR